MDLLVTWRSFFAGFSTREINMMNSSKFGVEMQSCFHYNLNPNDYSIILSKISK